MSWLTILVRDIVEPATLAILQWAWSFDSADAPPALTLPSPILRLFFDECASVAIRVAASLAASHASSSLASYSSFLAGGYLRYLLLSRCDLHIRGFIALATKLSLLLFRCTLVGSRERRVLALFEALHSVPRLGSAAAAHIDLVSRSIFLACTPYGLLIIDRTTAALGPPPPLRAFPAVARDERTSSLGTR